MTAHLVFGHDYFAKLIKETQIQPKFNQLMTLLKEQEHSLNQHRIMATNQLNTCKTMMAPGNPT